MNRSILAGVLIVVAGVLGTQMSEATPSLSLSDGTTTILIADNALGDYNSALGAVTYVGAVGAFTLTVSTGVSVLGSSYMPYLDLSTMSVTYGGSSGGTLTVMFTDNDFAPLMPAPGAFASAIGGVTAGNLTFSTYLDGSNALFGTGTLLGAQQYGPGPFSGTFGSSSYLPGSPYSLTEIVTVTLGGEQAASFNAELQATPEPASLLLLGTGLLGLGFLSRRKLYKRKIGTI